MKYDIKLDNLKKRRTSTDNFFMFGESVSSSPLLESYEKLSEEKSIKYAIGAMEEVGKKYTLATIEEGERVKNHLKEIDRIEFEYQGSVTNNTHIRENSDIDILVITKKYFALEPPLKPTNPYSGSPNDDLLNLRKECFNILKDKFPKVKIDDSGAKSIALDGGSLKRKVDVVPANWYDTIKYNEERKRHYRGVEILDKYKNERILNTPFYHNELLEIKDKITNQNYKKIVRLLKTLKADSERKISFSSYDITAIAYCISNEIYFIEDTPLLLIENILKELKKLVNSKNTMDLEVPDKSRKIFDKKEKIDGFKVLILELEELHLDIVYSLDRTYQKISKSIKLTA